MSNTAKKSGLVQWFAITGASVVNGSNKVSLNIYRQTVVKYVGQMIMITRLCNLDPLTLTYEPQCEKTCLRGFRPGPTQSRLYNHTRWLEA